MRGGDEGGNANIRFSQEIGNAIVGHCTGKDEVVSKGSSEGLGGGAFRAITNEGHLQVMALLEEEKSCTHEIGCTMPRAERAYKHDFRLL